MLTSSFTGPPLIALQRSCDQLEERVEQKTAELARSKAALQESMEAVQRSEAEFRQLAESMPEIVWTARSHGVLDLLQRTLVCVHRLRPRIGVLRGRAGAPLFAHGN